MTVESPVPRTGKRFLLLSPILPCPPDSGAAQRTFLLFKALQAIGHVDLLLVGDFHVPQHLLPTLRTEFNYLGHVPRQYGRWAPQRWGLGVPRIDQPLQRLVYSALGWRYTFFRNATMRSAVAERLASGHYDAVVTRYLTTAYQAGVMGHPALYVDLDDLESEVWANRAAAEKRRLLPQLYRRIASSYRKKEQELVARCAAVWVTKTKDLQALGHRAVRMLPNIPFASYPEGVAPLPPATRPVVLGVAVYDWLPNREGFDWFVREVWPHVRRAVPDAELHLVGKLSDETLKRQWSQTPGVFCLGRVDDLRAAYQSALLTIAPLFGGGGTNIKVIESLAYGRCCVVTPSAAKGFESMEGLYVAGDASAFGLRCQELLGNIEATGRQGLGAALPANQGFSFKSFSQAVRDAVMAPRR
nr:glycosyltransferase family 4 protein [Variovorax boronicumulans]